MIIIKSVNYPDIKKQAISFKANECSWIFSMYVFIYLFIY
jgi:hypothetical protein